MDEGKTIRNDDQFIENKINQSHRVPKEGLKYLLENKERFSYIVDKLKLSEKQMEMSQYRDLTYKEWVKVSFEQICVKQSYDKVAEKLNKFFPRSFAERPPPLTHHFAGEILGEEKIIFVALNPRADKHVQSEIKRFSKMNWKDYWKSEENRFLELVEGERNGEFKEIPWNSLRGIARIIRAVHREKKLSGTRIEDWQTIHDHAVIVDLLPYFSEKTPDISTSSLPQLYFLYGFFTYILKAINLKPSNQIWFLGKVFSHFIAPLLDYAPELLYEGSLKLQLYRVPANLGSSQPKKVYYLSQYKPHFLVKDRLKKIFSS